MKHSLPIVDKNNKIFLYYYKAHHYLHSNFISTGVDIRLLWSKYFNANVDYENRIIQFNSERDKTLFLLKCS